MILSLQRDPILGPACHGHLSIDDHPATFVTIENAAKRVQEGRYPLSLYYSMKNHRMVPLIDQVPGRSYCEFHPANFWRELDGCVAPGLERDGDAIVHSVAAFETLMKILKPQLTAHPQDTWLEVREVAVTA